MRHMWQSESWDIGKGVHGKGAEIQMQKLKPASVLVGIGAVATTSTILTAEADKPSLRFSKTMDKARSGGCEDMPENRASDTGGRCCVLSLKCSIGRERVLSSPEDLDHDNPNQPWQSQMLPFGTELATWCHSKRRQS